MASRFTLGRYSNRQLKSSGHATGRVVRTGGMATDNSISRVMLEDFVYGDIRRIGRRWVSSRSVDLEITADDIERFMEFERQDKSR